MKRPNAKRIHWLWLAPAGILSILALALQLNPERGIPACDDDLINGTEAPPHCGPAINRSRARPDQLRVSVGQADAVHSPPAGRGYTDRRIRLLNDLKPMPESNAELLEAIDRLARQQVRFERRYGRDSVAARSVRLRLHQLNAQLADGMQYAGQDDGQLVGD